MSGGLSLLVRLSRVDLVRAAIDAGDGGALHLHGGTIAATPETAPGGAPLCVIALANPCGATGIDGADANLVFDVPLTGSAAASGVLTWARFVDGNGVAVQDSDVGEPGSGLPIIVSDATVFTGGEVTVLSMAFAE